MHGRVVWAQSAQTTFARAVAAYRDAATFRARFEQTLTNGLTGTTSTAHGELFRKRPNLFAIVFAKPLTDRIVDDGTSLWVYLPSSVPGQVMRTRLGRGDGTVAMDPLGELLSGPADRYVVSDGGVAVVGGHATHVVGLVPKRDGDAGGVTKATLWVDDRDHVVREIETVETSGVRRRVVIESVEVNGGVPRSVFAFVVPDGVRVVDGR
jgi:outer membrane lipoprotein carrier protein